MASFRKKDQIEHPNYGRGTILNVKKGSGTMLLLDVEFPDSGVRKQLSAQWVEQHCQHLPYVDEEKRPAFRDGTYTLDPALSGDSWQVYPEKDTPLTELVSQGLQYMLRHILPGVHFVVIGPYAAVLMYPEEASTDREMEKVARRHMERVFRQHPDFGCTENEDGSIVLTMRDAALCLFLPAHFVEKDPKRGGPTLKCLLQARNTLMSNCYEAKMYAIVRTATQHERSSL